MVFTLSESGLVSGHYVGLFHAEFDSKRARDQLNEILRDRYSLSEADDCGIYKSVSGFVCTLFIDNVGALNIPDSDQVTEELLEALNSVGTIMTWSKPADYGAFWETQVVYSSMQFFFDWSQRTAKKF